MLSGNTTDKTAAVQITANVVLGQFLKVCSNLLSARFTARLALRLASLLASRTSTFFVEGVAIPLYELANIELGKRWRDAQHSLSFREPPMATSNDANARSCLACHLGPGPRM